MVTTITLSPVSRCRPQRKGGVNSKGHHVKSQNEESQNEESQTTKSPTAKYPTLLKVRMDKKSELKKSDY